MRVQHAGIHTKTFIFTVLGCLDGDQVYTLLRAGQLHYPLQNNEICLKFILAPRLCEKLVGLIKKYELPFSSLKLEITETSYMDNPKQLIDTVKKLKNYGLGLYQCLYCVSNVNDNLK